jgi:hypothetical protein
MHIQQSHINKPTIPTCYYQPNHQQNCTCTVRQYPWHDLDGYILDKRGDANISLHTYFDYGIYSLCFKNLANGKNPGPDTIPNSILKHMPQNFHHMLYLFFTQCFKQRQIPTSWKTSLTILLYKKVILLYSLTIDQLPLPTPSTNFLLALTTILSGYGKKYQILHDSQEGFCAECSTTQQLQIIISALEDTKLTNQDIYLLYIDFKNAFGSADHARLLAIMTDLGYPDDVIHLIGNIYSQSTTKFTGAHFGETKPIHIQRGTIQGDTLSPYLFIIFIEPLLRWFQRGSNGYKFKTSDATINSAAFADDLVALTHTLPSIQNQLYKLNKFCKWSGMDLGIPKCAITGCPNESKMNPTNFKTFITTQNIHYRNQPIPILHQDEPYTYLGIQLVPSLKWKLQIHITTTKLRNQCKKLTNCLLTIKQKMYMTDTVIRAGIAYSFYVVPYSLPTLKKLDKKLIALQKKICGLPNCTSNITMQLPHGSFGMQAFSLQNAYLRCIGEQLQKTLNNTGKLGIIYRGLTHFILATYGGALNIPCLTSHDCTCSPITRTLYLLKTARGIHLQSTLHNFPLLPTSLETNWLEAATSYPHLSQQFSLKLLNKLLLHHITDLQQIILPNGTHLMDHNDFKTYYDLPTKIIKIALKTSELLFCHPTCLPQCHMPCIQHLFPRTLNLQYIINIPPILPNQRPTIHTPIPHLLHPLPPRFVLNNLIQFPIQNIIDHKEYKLFDTNKIVKKIPHIYVNGYYQINKYIVSGCPNTNSFHGMYKIPQLTPSPL